MATQTKFLSGNIDNIPQEIVDGQVYFAVTDEQGHLGQILYDKDEKRYVMSSSSSTNAFLATCNTSSNNSIKIIEISTGSWELKQGQIIFILFSETNTASCPLFSIYKNSSLIKEEIPILYKKNQILTKDLDKAGNENYILEYIYDGLNFRYIAGFGDESKGRFYNSTPKSYKVGEKSIKKNNLIGLNMDGKLVPASSEPFLVGAPLYISNVDYEVDSTGNNTELFDRHYEILLYNDEELVVGEKYKPLFLVGNIKNCLFYPDQNPYSISMANDGKCYLYIGEFNNQSINFNTNHPIYLNNKIYSSVEGTKQLEHSLKIGTYIYNGSENIEIPIYDGSLIN